MKENKSNRVLSAVAFIVLSVLILVSIWANFSIAGSKELMVDAKFPGLYVLLFDYSYFASHPLRMCGQVIGNIIAYILIICALICLICSIRAHKNNKIKRNKSVILSLGLIIPATVGLGSGVINFFASGYTTLMGIGVPFGSSLAFLMTLIYVLGILYIILASIYLFKGFYNAKHGTEPEAEKSESERFVESLEQIKNNQVEKIDYTDLAKENNRLLKEILGELKRLGNAAPIAEAVPVEEVEEAEEVEEEEEEAGFNFKGPRKPRVPFAKKMLKADAEIKERYNELKNEFLSYGLSSRVSINGDTFRLHRKAYVMITLVGKTLKLYYALRLKDYEDSPIPVEDASDKAKYVEIPVLFRVKSDLAVRRAKDLVRDALAKDGYEKLKVAEDIDWMKDLRQSLKK